MKVVEAFRMAFRTIRAQKLKSFFSLIGVLIGVTFLIAVVSIVQGLNRYMVDRFANTLVGANTFELRQRPNIITGNVSEETWLAWRRRPRISYSDADFVRDRIHTPATFAKYCSDRVSVIYGGKVAKDVDLVGTESPYFSIRNYEITAGRPFSPQEVETALPVLVIGNELATKLLPGIDPLGKSVQIGGLPYRIIGVVAKQGTLFGLSLDKFAIMPFNAPARRLICPINILDALIVRTADPTSMEEAMSEAESAMRSRRQLKPWQESNFAFQTADSALGTWKKISRILFLALPGLVAISLVVGGIVIMNIMLMAVSERTREIGIRKALGARRSDILAQFVVESAALSLAGALAGIGFGLALAWIVKQVTPLPAAVAPWSILVGVVLGISVGIAAGVYPASRASRLDPIVALRAE
ncbi:MAG TPA: ABC transporter permease [Gemmatimonadales bacterium]|jgi:putative ABC transport system permease protein